MSTERQHLEALKKNRDVLNAFHDALRDEDRQNPSDENKRRAKELIEVIARHNRDIADLELHLQSVELPPRRTRRDAPQRRQSITGKRRRAARWNTLIG